MAVAGDINAYDWNEGRIEKSNSEIIKKIEAEESFSSYVYKDLKSKRYGIGGCCSFDKLEGSIIDKELCDWRDITKPVYTREYKDIAWLYNTEPWPEWLQFGDYDPNIGPCINNDCPKYRDPIGSTKWVQLMINMDLVEWQFTPTGDWAGANPQQNPPINSSGMAVMYALAKNWEDPTEDNWQVVGKSRVPTGPNDDALGDGGNIWQNPNTGNWFWRFHVYYNVPGSGFVDGAIPGQLIKFIIVDGDVQYEVAFDYNVWPSMAAGGGAWGQYHLYPAVTYGVPFCAVCIAGYEFTQKDVRFAKICDDRFEDCWFCGMEAVYGNGTNEPAYIDDQPIGFRCVDDSACLHIEVKNQCGAPIQNYPIILDGIDVGSTDEYGIFRFTITDTWIDENDLSPGGQGATNYQGTPFGEPPQLMSDYSTHTINTCEFCFITWGDCNQHKIDITVNDPRKDCENCKPVPPALQCVDITPLPEVVTPDTPPETPSSWICDTDYETQWYGCVEIIGTQGYATQGECEQNCIEPEPPRPDSYWQCVQSISEQGATGSICTEIVGDNPGDEGTYATEADCLEGCQDWQAEGCWSCSGMPNYVPQWNAGQAANFTDCWDTLSAFQTMVAQGNGFCEPPPTSFYQGCGCQIFPNVFQLQANNGDTLNPNLATFETLEECQTWSEENCIQVPPGPDWDTITVESFLSVPNGTMGLPSYPYYGAADEMPIELTDASNDLTFFTNNPNQANRFIMVPILWPGDGYWSGSNPDWTEDFRVGSNITFRVHVSYEATGPGEIMPFGPGNSWVINASDLSTSTMADHSRAFYVLNNYSILQILGLPIGSLNNNVPGLDIWAPDYSDTFVDYVSVEQNYSYPNGYDGMGTVNYYYDIKFDRDLCITNGAANALQMPLIEGGGVMLYMPVVLINNCEEGSGAPLSGADKTITVNFIPATEIGNEAYVTAVNQYTGDSVNFQIDEGISGTINGCVGTNCPECKPESSRIICYRCQNGMPVGQQFAGPDCPQGWTTDETPCTPDWDVDPFES